ncbi:MAG: class I SAM-dependent methyltransferase [Marinibacterium sp.]
MQTDAMFWDGIARRYAARPVGDPAAYEATLDRVRHYLGRHDRVLELGCGTGTTALLLAPAVGEYVASDVSPEMIAIGNEKLATDPSQGLRFEVARARQAGTGDRFDAVLAFNLLHLLEDLPAALAGIRDRLPEGGLFISKTPCLASKKWLLWPVLKVMQLVGKAPFVRFLNPEGLQDQLRTAGFEILETGDYPAKTGSRLIVARKGQRPSR